MKNFEEKRKHKRILLEGYIAIYPIVFDKKAKPLKGKFKNVSEGGILFESSSKIDIGSLLKIEFFLPNNKALAVRYKEFANLFGKKTVIIGKVVRHVKNGENWELGIQFINMYEGDFVNLKRFLELLDKNFAW